MKEIFRVLTVGGVYVLITYGLPDQRQNFLQHDKLDWKILDPIKIDKPIISTSISLSPEDKEAPDEHYIFLCRKVSIH